MKATIGLAVRGNVSLWTKAGPNSHGLISLAYRCQAKTGHTSWDAEGETWIIVGRFPDRVLVDLTLRVLPEC